MDLAPHLAAAQGDAMTTTIGGTRLPPGPRHLGFLLDSSFPQGSGPSELVVVLHERPTLAHFDPELVCYWRTGDDLRGHVDELTLATRLPVTHGYSWGKIELIDRFGIENDFVSVGGTVTAEPIEEGALVSFRSPVPILRIGGHSQAVDRIALDLGAFFGRIMVPIDFRPGAEEEVASAPPATRWSAFIAFEHARYAAYEALRDEHPAEAAILREQDEQLRRSQPDAWAGGRRLLDTLGLPS
jgi:hypothetical protein